jgi:hypothetical protein
MLQIDSRYIKSKSEKESLLLEALVEVLFTRKFTAALSFSTNLKFVQAGDDLATAERPNRELYQVHYKGTIEGGMHKDCTLIAFSEWNKSLIAFATTFVLSFGNC